MAELPQFSLPTVLVFCLQLHRNPSSGKTAILVWLFSQIMVNTILIGMVVSSALPLSINLSLYQSPSLSISLYQSLSLSISLSIDVPVLRLVSVCTVMLMISSLDQSQNVLCCPICRTGMVRTILLDYSHRYCQKLFF